MNLRCDVNIPQASLTSGTTYNLLAGTAPANQRIAIEGFQLFGAANAANTPGLLQFCRATSGGAGGTAITPKPLEEECTETPQSSWINQPATPPSGIAAFNSREVNPQLGLPDYFPQGSEVFMKGGGFFCLQFTSQWTGNYAGFLRINE